MAKNTMKRLTITVVVLVLIIATSVALYHSKRSTITQHPVTIDTTNQPTVGKETAKVHIVAFEDLKCMACKNFNNTLLPQIKGNYINPGIAKYTVINLAFIPGSLPAANAARCLYHQNPDFFFPFIDYVYQNQPPENENWATIPKLVEFAAHIPGIDQQKLSQCIYDSPYNNFFQKNAKQAHRLMDAQIITPTVYINGILIRPLTWENIQMAVKKAEKSY